jgi:hypothetical protein
MARHHSTKAETQWPLLHFVSSQETACLRDHIWSVKRYACGLEPWTGAMTFSVHVQKVLVVVNSGALKT